jgi:mono/diheme cytochrome c family protein
MREIIARSVCLFTVSVVLALSLLFAYQRRPSETINAGVDTSRMAAGAQSETNRHPKRETPIPESPGDEAALQRGRAVYAEQKCATCHSIAGQGNPRNPLDGVASRWDAAELRDWTTGTGVAAEVLSPAILKRKERFRSLPEQDLKALVTYLSSLVAGRQPTQGANGKQSSDEY